eukprot:366451-Chlamydomonas_euryale.AAC.12
MLRSDSHIAVHEAVRCAAASRPSSPKNAPCGRTKESGPQAGSKRQAARQPARQTAEGSGGVRGSARERQCVRPHKGQILREAVQGQAAREAARAVRCCHAPLARLPPPPRSLPCPKQRG